MDWMPIPEFVISHGITFYCICCKRTIQAMRNGSCHVATQDFCTYCGAMYSVDWRTPIEQSVVEMAQSHSIERAEEVET